MRIRRLAAAVPMLMVAALTAFAVPAQASPTLHFSKAYVNSPGADSGTNTNLNGEYILVKNSSTTTGYTLTG